MSASCKHVRTDRPLWSGPSSEEPKIPAGACANGSIGRLTWTLPSADGRSAPEVESGEEHPPAWLVARGMFCVLGTPQTTDPEFDGRWIVLQAGMVVKAPSESIYDRGEPWGVLGLGSAELFPLSSRLLVNGSLTDRTMTSPARAVQAASSRRRAAARRILRRGDCSIDEGLPPVLFPIATPHLDSLSRTLGFVRV